MKISDIDSTVKITDLENFFSVYEDKRGNYSYNLNEGLYIQVDDILEYTLNTDAFWPLISYKLYQTPRLTWLLMKLNNVNGKQIFEKKHTGDTIKYLRKEYVDSIVTQL